MAIREVFVVSAARTAIGSFGGSLKDVPMVDLATVAVRASIERSGLQPSAIEHVVLGNVIPTEARDAYVSRYASINAGVPKETPAMNVNRLCGSGLQAVISAAQCIFLGDAQITLGGGVESMSRGPYLIPAARSGARLGDTTVIDYMNGILHDPWDKCHMGITAENVAERYAISREMQDELSAESQKRAARAIAEGRFAAQIVAVEVPSKKGPVKFDVDENVRQSVTTEQLSKMKPIFKTNGSVTAGNASSINDGAAALVLASGEKVKELNLIPLARLAGYAHAGVDPAYMGMGPVPATTSALKRAGLKLADLSVIESNEAFAAQACAVIRELDLDPDRVNPNDSGISLGHPVGATGAIIATKAIHELQRIKGRYALLRSS